MKQESQKLSKTEKELLRSWISDYEDNKKHIELELENFDFGSLNDHQQFDTAAAWSAIEPKLKEETPVRALNTERKPWMKIAAALLVLTISVLAFQNWNSGQMAFEQIAVTNAESTIKSIDLPDGSTIHLSPGATLNYEKSTFDDDRTVNFTGIAYFDIAKNNGQNFTIYTDNFEVEVLGTEFQINTHPGEQKVLVTEGRVEVRKGSEKIELTVNEQAEINGGVKKSKTFNANEIAWYTQKITFENSDLKEYLRDVSQYYDVQFDLIDVDLSCKITASYTTESLKEVLEELNMIFGVEYKVEDKLVTLQNLHCK